jgi:hypothetical protein
LSLYRLVQGGLISAALFLIVCLCIRGGKTFQGSTALGGRDASGSQAQPLTPSDLATIHVECAKQVGGGCPAEAKEKVSDLDEMTALESPLAAQKQHRHELLLPSGRYGIGRVLYRWPQPQAIVAGRPDIETRTVFVWYPSNFQKPAGFEQERRHTYANVWDYSRANQMLVETHTLEKPPIASGSNRFPIILFYPSMNTSSAAYTTQIENLVSHGYVVASLEPRTDPRVVAFSNSQLLPFAADIRKAYREAKTESRAALMKRALAMSLGREKSLAADLSFVLDRLTAMNQNSRDEAPFAGRLDLSRVGAIGHSDGGTAAALACDLDKRILACISENGWTPDGPKGQAGSAQSAGAPSRPFLWIDLPLASPENEQLAYVHLRRAELDSMIGKSESLAKQKLHLLGSGTYRVTVRLPEVTDNYFTDGPLVWSMLHPQGSVTERNVLVIVNLYVRAFFDRYLRAGSDELLDGSVKPFRNVLAEHYGATRARSDF